MGVAHSVAWRMVGFDRILGGMKTGTLAVLVVGLMFLLPLGASADTKLDLQSQMIATLTQLVQIQKQLIEVLTSQIAQLQGQVGQLTVSSATLVPSPIATVGLRAVTVTMPDMRNTETSPAIQSVPSGATVAGNKALSPGSGCNVVNTHNDAFNTLFQLQSGWYPDGADIPLKNYPDSRLFFCKHGKVCSISGPLSQNC